jgi:translation initiation factor IF-3
MFTRDAIALAQQRGLDLVEVAPNEVPPVCKLMDYGKFKYDQTKKERDARKTQKQRSAPQPQDRRTRH